MRDGGVDHEWGRLREAVVGIAPRDGFVVMGWAPYLRWGPSGKRSFESTLDGDCPT
jgi:hypothetical protein